MDNPTLPPRAKLPLRIKLMIDHFGCFEFLDHNFSWSFRNDPHHKELANAKLHEKVHTRNRTIGHLDNPKYHSDPIRMDPPIPFPAEGSRPHSRNTPPIDDWYPSHKEYRKLNLSNPIYNTPDEFFMGSASTRSCASGVRSVSLHEYEDTNLGIQLNRNTAVNPAPEFIINCRSLGYTPVPPTATSSNHPTLQQERVTQQNYAPNWGVNPKRESQNPWGSHQVNWDNQKSQENTSRAPSPSNPRWGGSPQVDDPYQSSYENQQSWLPPPLTPNNPPPRKWGHRSANFYKANKSKRSNSGSEHSDVRGEFNRQARAKRFAGATGLRSAYESDNPVPQGDMDRGLGRTRLSDTEVLKSFMGIPNQGLAPIDEVLDLPTFQSLSPSDQHAFHYKVELFILAQLMGVKDNQNKHQREICHTNSRLRVAGIPRPPHTLNPGIRPIETQPLEEVGVAAHPFDSNIIPALKPEGGNDTNQPNISPRIGRSIEKPSTSSRSSPRLDVAVIEISDSSCSPRLTSNGLRPQQPEELEMLE